MTMNDRSGSGSIPDARYNDLVERVEELEAGDGGGDGTLVSKDFLFTEEATAGVYTATLPILAGTYVYACELRPLATWAADNVDVEGGNVAHPKLLLDQIDFGHQAAFDPVSGSGQFQTSQGGGDQFWSDTVLVPNGNGVLGYLFDADDVFTFTFTSTIAVPPVVPTGLSSIRIAYLTPVTAIDATFS